MDKLEVELFGSVGLGLLLSAFLLNISGKIKTDSYTYYILNTAGGYIMTAYSFMDNIQKTYPFAILNGIWGSVGLFGLIRKYLKKV